MKNALCSVITTIQKPTDAVFNLSLRLNDIYAKLIVVGDRKGPKTYPVEGVEFYSLQKQLESQFELAHKIPTNHYTRKNIGYLAAIAKGASCIYETDDDNAPLPGWTKRHETVQGKAVQGSGWVNIYQLFTEERIWPRGFPLDEVMESFLNTPAVKEDLITLRSPIQQGLSDNSPDVDAIWRLVMDQPFHFEQDMSVYLLPGSWCPFNSQSTWWWPEAYPLLYLPSYCSFRMTDIWRSFIAQRCLWELGYGVVFHAPEVIQDRNVHNLMRDFKDEIPGYIRNKEFVEVLEELSLEKGLDAMTINLKKCSEALVKAEFFPEKELALLNTWLEDLEKIDCF